MDRIHSVHTLHPLAKLLRFGVVALLVALLAGAAQQTLRADDPTGGADAADAGVEVDGEADEEEADGDEPAAAADEEEWPLFSLHNLFTLLMLTLLQAVLGFDNLLYISIESKRVPLESQAKVRRMGIGLAIALRIILLFAVMSAIQYFQDPFWTFETGLVGGSFNVHSLIVVAGGVFIMYTAVKEIHHMLIIEDISHEGESDATRSVGRAVFWIVLMNLIFSFDSILSALALTNNFAVMATAIIISGMLMIFLSDHVADFLKKNRMFEVLGLFILFIVGVMLLSEGGHLAHLHLADYKVQPMTKSTFYFVLIVLVLIDLVQGRYQKKLALKRQVAQQAHKPAPPA